MSMPFCVGSLSRRRQGFESPWGRHFLNIFNFPVFSRLHRNSLLNGFFVSKLGKLNSPLPETKKTPQEITRRRFYKKKGPEITRPLSRHISFKFFRTKVTIRKQLPEQDP